jgi:copper(I)-binding protein
MTGDFKAGDFIRLTLGFSNGDRVTLHVPVVANAGNYADLDGPAPDPSETPETENNQG